MAYKIIAEQYVSETDRLTVLVCDSAADLTSAGTSYAPGSIAIIPGAKNYKLNASGTWVQDA